LILYNLTIFHDSEEATQRAKSVERLMRRAAAEVGEPNAVSTTFAGPPASMAMQSFFIESKAVLDRFLALGGDHAGVVEDSNG